MNIGKTICFAALASVMLGACTDDKTQIITPPEPIPTQVAQGSGNVFVHLFEWRWPDIAAECENFLGPNAYAAVQVSPPQEHVPGPQWWTRYQPVSYQLESRGGTRTEFADMVQRCKAAGVDVYVDALTNHMARAGEGTGVAGSVYTLYNYPVPYGHDDFHHCGRNGDDGIVDYQDLWEIQNCELVKLADLDTSKPEVQKKIAAYLNDLLSLGVAGFRLDAAKHVAADEVSDILALLDSKAFVFQEVIDRGGEPISAMAYLPNGSVTEFKYPQAMFEAFEGGGLGLLSDLDTRAGFLPADKAVVFVDNHDLQRGHAGGEEILNYKSGKLYDLANVFMLGWPYGYPKVMSSYRFEDSDQGPPPFRPVEAGQCTEDWVCEHRRPTMVGMVEFRKATEGAPVTNWQAYADQVIAFGRGDKGYIVINTSAETIDGTFVTGMKGGEYCNVVSTGGPENDCRGSELLVDDDGVLQISVAPMSAVVIQSTPAR